MTTYYEVRNVLEHVQAGDAKIIGHIAESVHPLTLDALTGKSYEGHIEGHPETVYVAASGVNLANEFGVLDAGQEQVAIEWVRTEPNPTLGEPECNTNRYLFGYRDGEDECIGLDITRRPSTGQVADHWTTFDDAYKKHFPD